MQASNISRNTEGLKKEILFLTPSLSSNDLDLEKNESPSEWKGGGWGEPRNSMTWNIGIIQECS